MRGIRLLACAWLALVFLGAGVGPGWALVINPIFDASVRERADFPAVQAAFAAAAAGYTRVLGGNATINVQVSFGRVGTTLLPSSALGASVDPLYGYFSYAQVRGWLGAAAGSAFDQVAVASLGASSPAGNRFVVPRGQAKALGLVAPDLAGVDGYIGFGTGRVWDFDPLNGITAGSYDFTAVAAHEIAHVLGRMTGLRSAAPGYATPFDLFRCSGGVRSFSYVAAANFSIDGCATSLGAFNVAGSGDRADWASGVNAADVQNAYLLAGRVSGLSAADVIALDVLGWGNLSGVSWATPGTQLVVMNLVEVEVPEPAPVAVFLLGVAGLGLVRVRRGR